MWSTPTPGLPQDLFVGDDGNVYVLSGGSVAGEILVLRQDTGELKLAIDQVPAPWEIILQDGVVYVAGDSGVVALPLPEGFARNYDPNSPWPVRQQNNQRTASR